MFLGLLPEKQRLRPGAQWELGNASSSAPAAPAGNVRVLEAATSVLEEKLAATQLEATSAHQTRIMLEEKVAALQQENAWLQQHVKSQKTDADENAWKKREDELLHEIARITTERDAAVASMKGQLNELRVGASAIGAKIALTEEVDRLKAQIAPLQAALEAERSWAKELEQQLEGEKTAKLALVAKSGAMVKALRQQLDEAKTAHARAGTPGPGGAPQDSEAAVLAELDAKQALAAKQALEREVVFLRDRNKSLQNEVEAEKAKLRDKEIRNKGKMDALIEKALAEREAALAGAYKGQIEELLTKLAQAQAREKELMAALQGVMGGLK